MKAGFVLPKCACAVDAAGSGWVNARTVESCELILGGRVERRRATRLVLGILPVVGPFNAVRACALPNKLINQVKTFDIVAPETRSRGIGSQHVVANS